MSGVCLVLAKASLAVHLQTGFHVELSGFDGNKFEFDGAEFLECIKDLIRLDKDWVPKAKDCSLYLRPTFIGTQPFIGVNASQSALLYCIMCPVGPYFKKNKDDPSSIFSPVSLYADPKYIRAWPGGVGDTKIGGNYGPTIRVQKIAETKGCNQVLWLLGEDRQVTEVGTMNVFFHWTNEQGEPEIATPPLLGSILPGVTRKSLLELGKSWGTHKVVERYITMKDVTKAVKDGRLKEMFGAGTASVVCPINRILYQDENIRIPTMETGAVVASRFYKELTDIQYGRVPHEWSVVIN
eukprot:Em0003g1292a